MHLKTTKLRLAIVSSHIDKSLQFEWFEEALKQKDIEHIHIIISQFKDRSPYLVTDLRQLGINVFELKHKNIFSLFVNIFKAARLLCTWNINIVHTTLPYGNIVGQTAALFCGIRRRVTTCENVSWAHDFKNRKQLWIDRYTFRLSKKIIFVADSALEYADKHWEIKQSKITTIYHGLKEHAYDTINTERVFRLREQLQIRNDDFVVGMIARLEFWKGHQYAIDAMRIIVEKDPTVKLYIFGSKGPDHDKILNQIKDLHLERNVFYKGFVDDPIALFQLFDIHLHIPINKYVENCGISIIEGMISARTQILTLSGYAAQSARNGKNAFVVNYQNSEDVAEAILKLKNDPELRQQLAEQARKDALKEYSNTVKTEKHLNLYNSLF